MEAVLRRLGDHERKNEARVAQCLEAPAPSLLEDVQLHDYQLEGMRWLLCKHAQGLNPILGDEMGLGKTLQVIAFIASLMEATGVPVGNPSRSRADNSYYLVVAPLSVVPNWVEQFNSFAPRIKVHMYAGQKEERRLTQAAIRSGSEKARVVVTSYEMLIADTAFFNTLSWELMVLDEGHRLKNPAGKLYGLLQTSFIVERKVLLSGTPVQNELRELYALLALLNPSIFNDDRAFETTFKDYFSAKAQELLAVRHGPTTKSPANQKREAAEALMRQLLSPLLLLRTIQDVNSSFTLPPISEIVVHSPMSPMQREYYKEVVAKNSDVINSIATNGSRISLMNILPHLRKACNHPYLFPGAEPEPFCEGSHLYENSGKLFVLHQLLPRLRADGHSVLLFSQFTSFLDIIQDYLTLEGFSYERIDGSIRGKERWQAIERFRSSPDTFVFLLSTRSGGVGLNLQRADTVVFVDSDYNPQMDLQAVARAYRLGQTRPIRVIKFVTAHTVEEIIYRRALKKMRMADKIRNCAREPFPAGDDDEASSKESLVELVQFGLHKLLAEEDGDSNAGMKPLQTEYIDQILARTTAPEPTEIAAHTSIAGDALEDAAGDVKDENMHYFEGEDYSKSDAKTRDMASLRKLCLQGSTHHRKRGPATRRSQYAADGDDEDEESQEEIVDPELDALAVAEQQRKQEDRRQRMMEKKLAKWHANRYSSMAINRTDGDTQTANDDARGSFAMMERAVRLRFTAGDASHPSRSLGDASPAIIVHCVDTSGVWSDRGFFRRLSALSPLIQEQYEAAKRNEDLKLGQAHLIRIAPEESTAHQQTGGLAMPRPDLYVCLLVVQGFVSSSKKKQRVTRNAATAALVRRGKSTTFRLHALDHALECLAARAWQLQASIHMPRIGYGTPHFNWYAVERLIHRRLSDEGIPTSVYYFSPNRRA